MRLRRCRGRFAAQVAVAASLLLAGCGEEQAAQQRQAEQPPPSVTVTVVREQKVNEPYEFVGRVEAMQALDLRAPVRGFVQERGFEAGARVRAGDLLFVIEPDRYQAQLESARAELSRAEASLREAERQLERTRTLRERGTVSEATLDEAIAAKETAEAEVEVARAAVRAAEIDLEDTRIEAPFAGQIGRSMVTVGELVGPDSGPLARIVQLDPIWAVFSVGEADLVSLRMAMDDRSVQDPGAVFVPRIRLPNGEMYRHQGQIDFVASEVDPSTGTVPVRAVFPNENGLLLPGQFVTVLVRREEAERLPVVPQTAVQEDREGRYVFVVDDQNKVSQRRIQTGTRVEQGWAVEEGLQAGESIIVQGVQKVSSGTEVNPVVAGRQAEG